MNEDRVNPEKSAEPDYGSVLVGCSVGCLVQCVIVAGALFFGLDVLKVVLAIQWLSLTPLILQAYRKGRKDTGAGLIIAAIVGALLGTACAAGAPLRISG